MRVAFYRTYERREGYLFSSSVLISFARTSLRHVRSPRRPETRYARLTRLPVHTYVPGNASAKRASANYEMQEFKGAFSVRSTATPGVIVVIDGAIKARARRRVEPRVSHTRSHG